jgi:hypothetical protein
MTTTYDSRKLRTMSFRAGPQGRVEQSLAFGHRVPAGKRCLDARQAVHGQNYALENGALFAIWRARAFSATHPAGAPLEMTAKLEPGARA